MLCCEIIALHQTKLGNDAIEFEDAFAFGPILPRADASGNGASASASASATTIIGERVFVAIADGATESSFAGVWATMLVRAYRKGQMQSVAELRERAELLSHRWRHSLSFRRLPWYAEEKARMGAFSTLLGLTIAGSNEADGQCGTWWALAVGDSCLFHLRDNVSTDSFPIHHSSEFSNSPGLLSSSVAKNAPVWNSVATIMGVWNKGDVFVLATDALAHWLLAQGERGHQPWHEVMEIARDARANEAFASWVADCRANRALRNDDVTCLVLRL